MRQRPLGMTLALIVSGLLCACTAGRAVSPAKPSAASPAAATRTRPVVAYVRGFYRSYAAARERGSRAAMGLARARVAAWYFPVLEAPHAAGPDPVECGLRGPVTGWNFEQAGIMGGQAVIVIGSRPPGAPQELWIVVTAEQGTGKITGITCGSGGAGVTSTGARNAVTSLYRGYLMDRGQGLSPRDAIARLTRGGPETADPYLEQASYAITRKQVAYDPVTCAAAGIPGISAGTARVVAGRSIGVVVVSARRAKFLATVILGAKGWTVGDIACIQPSLAAAAADLSQLSGTR